MVTSCYIAVSKVRSMSAATLQNHNDTSAGNGQSQRVSYALASCKAMVNPGMQEPSEGNPALATAREKLFGSASDNQNIASSK